MSKFFGQSISFIRDALEKTNILVHCLAGVSRSVSLVMAYFIKYHGMSYDNVYSKIKGRRKIVNIFLFLDSPKWRIHFSIEKVLTPVSLKWPCCPKSWRFWNEIIIFSFKKNLKKGIWRLWPISTKIFWIARQKVFKKHRLWWNWIKFEISIYPIWRSKKSRNVQKQSIKFECIKNLQRYWTASFLTKQVSKIK